MSSEIIAKAENLIRQRTALGAPENPEPHCVLGLLDADGYPALSVITAAKSDGLARLYFDTGVESAKAQRIRRDPRASVCFSDATYGITLIGTIEIRTDPETRLAMWYPGMANHFTGPDDQKYCVLAFTTERYRLFVDWQEISGRI